MYPSSHIGYMGRLHPSLTNSNGCSQKSETPPLTFPSGVPPVVEPDVLADTTSQTHLPLVALLQKVQRPTDIKGFHFQSLGLQVHANAPPEAILPDPTYLPPVERWMHVPPEDLEAATVASQKPLNNGNLSPSLKTYLERRKELSIENTAAFRSIRRITSPTGETPVRLGNAYEFFKNLDLFSDFWADTSLPVGAEAEPAAAPEPAVNAQSPKDGLQRDTPVYLRTHHRTGTGAQLPPEYRHNLITAFIKLVAYDFGCNIHFPRVEPRLLLTPPPAANFPSSHFNSGAQFICRIPSDRSSARSGIVEGPLAAISCRTNTVFNSETDSSLDFAREIVTALLTAQQRARENEQEKRFGQGKWWATTPRWGGGPGGAMGKEMDKPPAHSSTTDLPKSSRKPAVPATTPLTAGDANEHDGSPRHHPIRDVKVSKPSNEDKRSMDRITAINATLANFPNKKTKRGTRDGNLAMYDTYRKMLPPVSNWDARLRYQAIGKMRGAGHDDIFLISALNHHMCVLRVRVPEQLLAILGGIVDDEQGASQWGPVDVWRSRWYDFFLCEDRVEVMGLIWGMMGWLMRAVDEVPAEKRGGEEEDGWEEGC